MHFLFLFVFLLLSLASCSPIEENQTTKKDQKRSLWIRESEYVHVTGKKRHKRNTLHKKEELSLQKKLSINSDMNFISSPLCRRYEGCVLFCSEWINDKSCNHLESQQVIHKWSSLISQLSDRRLVKHTKWIVENQSVSFFLQKENVTQGVMKQILLRLSQLNCPLFEDRSRLYYVTKGDDLLDVYLSSAEGLNAGRKKIIDSRLHVFNLNVFKGLMGQCLDGRALSFMEYAAKKKNTLAFLTGHQLLFDSCDHANQCMRMAYCELNSNAVWNQLNQIRKETSFSVIFSSNHQSENIQQCEYKDFISVDVGLINETSTSVSTSTSYSTKKDSADYLDRDLNQFYHYIEDPVTPLFHQETSTAIKAE